MIEKSATFPFLVGPPEAIPFVSNSDVSVSMFLAGWKWFEVLWGVRDNVQV